MANIAEGFGRAGSTEFHRFVTIARGSCFELLSHVYLASDLGYIHPAESEQLRHRIEEVSKILRALRTSLERHR
jgi:four helix bundle protein